MPPQTIKWVPVQIEVASLRGIGAPLIEIALQVSKTGLYWPPRPLQTIIRVPVHTAVSYARDEGAPVREVGSHVSAEGSYRPPVFVLTLPATTPPQTIIFVPVQTAA